MRSHQTKQWGRTECGMCPQETKKVHSKAVPLQPLK
nr:MAG TPA: hypothetical protein [Bacteriophage sp.]